MGNGMRFLLVRQPEAATVSAGWVVRVGSANEQPGTTGLTHLIEHMLFKGSETIGAPEDPRERARERMALARLEELREEVLQGYRFQQERARRGEIADPYDPETFPPALTRLLRSFEAEAERARAGTRPGELARLYLEAGAQGANALTLRDMSLFFVTVPAEKLELWFWLESDRLLAPVFRDFYTERRVVEEERRQRVESTPTGRFEERLSALFWGSHPYAWPVIGRPEDLRLARRSEAERYFAEHFRPRNLTAVLVGRFDKARVRDLAERYFGRLERSGDGPSSVAASPELRRSAERSPERFEAECDCRPQVEARYYTVPLTHPDAAVLDVLAGLLNGRTGRLYRSMVAGSDRESERAFAAYSQQTAMRWEGFFSFHGEALEGSDPEELLAAWDREAARLAREPVPADELAKVKNRIAADSFRAVDEPAALAVRLLMLDGFGDWRLVTEGARRALAVTPEDLQRVAARYLRPENRVTAIYRTRDESSAEAKR